MTPKNDRHLLIRCSEEFLRRVDEWRLEQPELPTRSHAIRQLIDWGLEASAQRAAAKRKKDAA